MTPYHSKYLYGAVRLLDLIAPEDFISHYYAWLFASHSRNYPIIIAFFATLPHFAIFQNGKKGLRNVDKFWINLGKLRVRTVFEISYREIRRFFWCYNAWAA